ncbi:MULTISPECIES: type IV pilin-like G/H family protein [unclassified Microcoleus]|uniref:type IV pilin-like G/H family protein n=1 Tax=unclassified Microcoleus TaxID=2642155 RepID=UPI002FD38F48
MSADIDKKSKTYSLSLSSLLVRTVIYSGFMAGILASFYNFKLNTIFVSSSPKSPALQADLASINKAQEDYYAKNNKFSDSLEGLAIQGLSKAQYYYHIDSLLINPVQTLENKREPAQFESAIAFSQKLDSVSQKDYSPVYIGAVFAFKKDVSNQLITISAICESEPEKEVDQFNLIQPTFDGTEIHCPPGTNILR